MAARTAPIMGLVAVTIAALLLLTGGGDERSHRLTATVDEAANVIKGQEVTSGGRAIGVVEAVTTVDRGRRAKLVLAFDDDAWPLPRGTRFTLRWGGTAAVYDRYISVERGRGAGPQLPDGGTIPAKDFIVPVEVDQLLATFDRGVRRDLKSFVNRSGATFARSERDLGRVLSVTPQALDEGTAVLSDLVADRGALGATLQRTDRVVDAVRRADPDLSSLLGGAAATFDAIAAEQQDLRTTLERLPATLSQVQGTLRHADGTLGRVGRLARRIGPGVRELRAAARPVDGVLASLQGIAPEARSTLATVRRSAGDLTGLLGKATTLSPQLGSIADKSVENLKCIRPYAPEIAGLLTTWGDFMSWNDGTDKVLRAQVQTYFPANYNSVPLTPEQAARTYSGLRYGFPRPPGHNAGQPWFLPECGAGEGAIDPSKDQEAAAPPSAEEQPPRRRR